MYRDANVKASVDEKATTITFTDVPDDLENPGVVATYIVGEGRDAVRTVVYEGELSDPVNMDSEAFKEAKSAGDGIYTIVVTSDNYADIAAVVE